MNLKTAKLQKHFYMYCALFYANNRTLGYKEWVSDLRDKVVAILEKNNIYKLDMPMHSYHYLMGLFNPNGYKDNGYEMKLGAKILDYVDQLSQIDELQKLRKEYEADFDQRLKEFEERFDDIKVFFSKHFDFEPDVKTFYLTRNWDTSGKCIVTEDDCYILVGWKKEGINLNQILHELTHSYLDKCNLTIPDDVNFYSEKMPKEVIESYARPSAFVEESSTRAIVVYLSRLEKNITDYSLVGTDLDMLLPVKYLEVLETETPVTFTVEYLNKLTYKK